VLVFLISLVISPCWAAPAGSDTPRPNKSNVDEAPGAPPRLGGQQIMFGATELAVWMQSAAMKEKITQLPYTKGGTEIWVQYEFEYAMKKKLGIKIQSRAGFREVKVYKEKIQQLADFAIVDNTGGTNSKCYVAELKVRSSSVQLDAFIKSIQSDQEKVKAELRPEYASCERAVLALAWEDEASTTAWKNRLRTIGMIPNKNSI